MGRIFNAWNAGGATVFEVETARRHKNGHLLAAFDQDGEEAFEVTLLESCDETVLLEREQHYLDLLKPEYNICQFAANTLGYRHTPESQAKMRQAHKRAKPFLGRKHTEESRRKLSAARAGRKLTPQHVAAIKASLWGNKHTAGRALTDEHRAKVSEASLRMWQEEGRRAARSEETKARWADPEWKARQLQKIAAGRAAKRAARGVE